MFSRISRSTAFYPLWRLLAAFIVAFAPLLSLTAPASAYLYSAPLTVTNNSTTTAYTMLPVVTPLNTIFLTTYGFMASSANDTRIQTTGGVDKPTMVSDNAVMTAVPVPITSQTNLLMTTGNTAQAMSIITGYGGYASTNDTAALEWGANGGVTITPYLLGANNIMLKPEAVAVSTNYTGNITAQMIGATWETPAVGLLSEAGLGTYNAAQLVDGNVLTNGFETNVSPVGSYLRLDYGVGVSKNLSGWRYYADNINNVSVWNIQYSDDTITWYNAYVGLSMNGAVGWHTATWWPTGGHRYWQSYLSGGNSPNFHTELAVLPGAYLTLPTPTGQSTITVNIDGGNARLAVNSSTAVTAFAAVVDAATDWRWMSNATPYVGSINMTVGGVEVLRYQPVAYIVHSTLPDRKGTKNGDIHWGVNPYPVTSNVSSLVAPTIAVVSAGTSGTTDILPAAGGVNTNQEPGVDSKLTTNPLRPIIQIISLNTSVTEAQAWVYAGLLIVLLPFPTATRKFKGHYVLTAILMCVMIFLVCAMGMWPWWALVFMAPIMLGGIIAERSPWL